MVFSKENVKRSVAVIALTGTLVAGSVSPAFAGLSGTLKIGGSSTLAPLAQVWQKAFNAINKGVKITIATNDSGTGRTGAGNGTYDLGMSSSTVSTPANVKGTACARDALTFITNSTNKVKSLTKAQLISIWKGQITNWKQVGGADAKIVVCGRAAGSGTGDYVNKDLFGSPALVSTLKTYATNGTLKNAVVANKNAIGYVGMSYATSKVRGLYINGVAPTRTNAKSGRYSFVRQLFWVTRTDQATSTNAAAFIAYSLSSKGQAAANTIYMSLR
jgi:phosphate transport system substrate-binding protein